MLSFEHSDIKVQPTIFLLPESPRWLFAIGRVEDANEIIAKMYATTTSSDIVTKIRAALQVEVEIESSTEEKGWRLFLTCVRAIFYDTTQLKLGRRLRLCILITFLQEMSGLNIVSASSDHSNRLFELQIADQCSCLPDCCVHSATVPA